MDTSIMQYPPGDPRMIDTIVYQLKSQGIFDQFRKECIADVDTKPAYQNLHQRVEGTVSAFLSQQIWRPDLNKNQLRESLRKHILESGYLDMGVERIVDQVVNPKIMTVLVPQVEDVVYKFIGVEKPKKNLDTSAFSFPPPNYNLNTSGETQEKKKDVSLTDLLPKDLDPVSPESDATKKSDNSFEDGELNDGIDADEEISPPFESLTKGEVISEDSNLSGISGLTSPDGNHSNISFTGEASPKHISFENQIPKSVGEEPLPDVRVDVTTADSSNTIQKEIQSLVLGDAAKSSSSSGSSSDSSSSSSDDNSSPGRGTMSETKDDSNPIQEPMAVDVKLEPMSVDLKQDADSDNNASQISEKQVQISTLQLVDYEMSSGNESGPRFKEDDRKLVQKYSSEKHVERLSSQLVDNEMSSGNESSSKIKEEDRKLVKKYSSEKHVERLSSQLVDNEMSSGNESSSKIKEEDRKLVKKYSSEKHVERLSSQLVDNEMSSGNESSSKIKEEDRKLVKKNSSEKHVERLSSQLVDNEMSSGNESSSKIKEEDRKLVKTKHVDSAKEKKDVSREEKTHSRKEKEAKSLKDEKSHKTDKDMVKDVNVCETVASLPSTKESKEDKKIKEVKREDKHRSSSKNGEKPGSSHKKDDKSRKHRDGKSSHEHRDDKVDKIVEKSESKSVKHKEERSVKSEHKSVKKEEKSDKKEDKTDKLDKKEEKVDRKDELKKEEKHSSDSNHSSTESHRRSSHSSHRSDKDKHHSSKPRKHSESEKKHRSGSEKTSDKDTRDKKSKEKKERKPVDDHDKHREKRQPEDRRSTDRDSNGPAHDRSASSSHTATTSATQRKEAKNSNSSGKTNQSGNQDSSESPRKEEYFCTSEEGQLKLKIKKPKIAANIFEVQKIIEMRKSLARLEQQKQEELDKVQLAESDTEDVLYLEPNPDDQRFIDFIHRIERSRTLSEISVSSVDSNDLSDVEEDVCPVEPASVPATDAPDINTSANTIASTDSDVEVPQEAVVAISPVDPSISTEMRPPETQAEKRETRRPRKPNMKYSLEDEPPAKRPRMNHSPTVVEDNNNKDKDMTPASDSSMEVPATKVLRLGPSRRVGLGRPKTAVRDSTPDFVMPLSPESDVSASSGDLARKSALVPSPSTSEEEAPAVLANSDLRKNQRRLGTPASKTQRYSSDDLYKPRPLFSRQTRRNRASPDAEAAAANNVDQHNTASQPSTLTLKRQR